MEKIASQRTWPWVQDSFRVYRNFFLPLVLFSFLAHVVMMAFFLPLACCMFAGGITSPVSFLAFGAIGGLALGAIVYGSQVGTALAALSGRAPTWEDFKIDFATILQVCLVILVGYAFLLVVLLLFLAPGLALLGLASAWDNTVLQLLSFLLVGLLSFLGMLVAVTLVAFALPLAIDKRYDFWTALTQSIDCARRDLRGLSVYTLFAMAVTSGVSSIPFVGTILALPLLAIFILRAYQDYFGLEEGQTPHDSIIGSADQLSPVDRHVGDSSDRAPSNPLPPPQA